MKIGNQMEIIVIQKQASSLYSPIADRPVSMLSVTVFTLKQESAQFPTKESIATAVILESTLVQEGSLKTSRHMGTKPDNGEQHLKVMGYILVQ